MKKTLRKKLLTIGLLAAAVIATVEFQKFMKRRATACEDGVCAIPAELIAAKVTGPQNVPLPVGTESEESRRLPQLIDFGAGQCATCKMMDVVLDELAQKYGNRLIIRYVDVHSQPDLTKQHAIRIIPTQIFFDEDGVELFRHEGFFSTGDIVKKWNELGVSL
ncbi:MAG: thioredoxin family protein [Kiritimatiellales bacterium]